MACKTIKFNDAELARKKYMGAEIYEVETQVEKERIKEKYASNTCCYDTEQEALEDFDVTDFTDDVIERFADGSVLVGFIE